MPDNCTVCGAGMIDAGPSATMPFDPRARSIRCPNLLEPWHQLKQHEQYERNRPKVKNEFGPLQDPFYAAGLDELGTGRTPENRPSDSTWYGSETGEDSIEISGDRVFMCCNGIAMFSGYLYDETSHSSTFIAQIAVHKWLPRAEWLCRRLIFPAMGPLGSGSLAAAEANRILSDAPRPRLTEQDGEDSIRRMLWRGL